MGNTFGATALSSYGGFWLSFAVILTPGGFNIESELMAAGPNAFADEFGLYLMVGLLCPQCSSKFFANCNRRAGSSSRPSFSSVHCVRPSSSSRSFSLWTWHSYSSVSATYTVTPWACPTHLSSRPVASSPCSRHSWLGIMLWLVLQTIRTGKPFSVRWWTMEHQLTLLQFLHHSSSAFPMVDQGDATEGQTGRGRQQDGLGGCLWDYGW